MSPAAARPDLTAYASTLPDLPSWVVPRDNLIALVTDRFGPERKTIVVRGPLGAGKTTILAQFVATAPTRAISFFIGQDSWSSDPDRFLYDLVQQLMHALGDPESTPGTTAQELRLKVPTLISRLAHHARLSGESYFLVVDSVDSGMGREGGIADLLPNSLPRNVYLLLSTAEALPAAFGNADIVDLPALSLAETTSLLRGLVDDPAAIGQIHSASRGFPAYVAEVRRELTRGAEVARVVNELPSSLSALFDRQWEAMPLDDDVSLLLAIVAYAPEPLSVSEVAALTERAPLGVRNALGPLHIVTFEGDSITFVTDWYRRMTQERLRHLRSEAEQRLIENYEQNPYSARSLRYLPELLQSSGRYERLRALISNEYLSTALTTSRDLSRLRSGLASASVGAAYAGDIAGLMYFSTTAALITTTVYQAQTLQREIRTLAATGDYEHAIAVAESALLPQDQLQAFGAVARAMHSSGLSIPRTVLDRIDELASEVPASTPADEASVIAASFFDVRPDAALRLIDRCAGPSGERALDKALLMLSLQSPASDESWDELRGRFQDPTIRDWASALALPAGTMTADEILARAAQVDDSPSRIYLLREWCNRNRANPDAARVIERAVQLITEATDYTPSLRVLRQLAEPLRACPEPDAQRLATRIEVLATGMPRTPLAEALRLRLLLAAQEWRSSFAAGAERVVDLVVELADVADLEVRSFAFGLVHSLLLELDPQDAAGLHADVLEGLEGAIGALLASTGDHQQVTKRCLRAVARRDIDLAVSLARRLNTEFRRSQAVRDVVSSYAGSLPDGTRIDISNVLSVIKSIETAFERESALTTLAEQVTRKQLDLTSAAGIAEAVGAMEHPGLRALARAALTGVRADDIDDLREGLAAAAFTDWSVLEHPWERAGLGVRVIEQLGSAPATQSAIASAAAAERAGSPGTNPFFSALFVDALVLSAAATASADLNDDEMDLAVRQMVRAVEQISSALVRCDVLSTTAARLLVANRQTHAKQLLEAALQAESAISNDYLRAAALLTLAAPLSMTDPEQLKDRIDEAPTWARRPAVAAALAFLVTGVPPDLRIEEGPLDRSLVFSEAMLACELLARADVDMTISWGCRLLVEAIVSKGRPSLNARQLATIAAELERIAASQLPNIANIKHPGYQLAVRAQARRLRFEAEPKSTAWDDIEQGIGALDNVADRAISWLWYAETLPDRERERRRRALASAEHDARAIPAGYDRAVHLKAIAEERVRRGENDSAAALLRSALSDVETQDADPANDDVVAKILELADSIDSEFASSLTPLIDDHLRQYSLERSVREARLRRRPAGLDAAFAEQDDLPEMIGRAAARMRSHLALGRGIAQPRAVVTRWLRLSAAGDFASAKQVAGWAVENARHGNWSAADRRALRDAAVQVSAFSWDLGLALCEAAPARATSASEISALELFKVGDRTEAIGRIQAWMAALTSPFLVVCDPYFTVEEMWALRAVPAETSVRIITGLDAQRGLSGDPLTVAAELAASYIAAWRMRYQQSPPPTQIIVLSGERDRRSPIHDRFLLAADAALALGTSLSGLGARDSSIVALGADESQRILREIVEPWLSLSPPKYKGDRVITYSFPLSP